MTVFKAILKIVNKNKGLLIMYISILISVTLINQTADNKSIGNFTESKPHIYIENNDINEGLTKGLITYLKKHSKIIKIDENKKDALDDAIFYRDVSFAIFIPEGFNDNLLMGVKPIVKYKSSGDYDASLTEMLIDKYMKTALLYKDYYSGDELIKKIDKVVDSKVKTKIKSKLDTNKLNTVARYYNFLNYALLAGCVYCITLILSDLKNKKVYKRTLVSSFNQKKYNRIVLFSNFIMIFFIWLVLVVMSCILFGDLMFTSNGLLFIFNSFVYMFFALAMGYLIGNITQNKNAIGGIINVVALGTSFLCGCFVPLEYLPESVISISKLLPTYYYVNSNEVIKGLEKIDINSLMPIFTNMIIILGCTVVFIIITNVINSKRKKLA